MVNPLNNVGHAPPVDQRDLHALNNASREFLEVFQNDKRINDARERDREEQRRRRGETPVAPDDAGRQRAQQPDPEMAPRPQTLVARQPQMPLPTAQQQPLLPQQQRQPAPGGNASANAQGASRSAPATGGAPTQNAAPAGRLVGVSLPQGLPGPVTVFTTPETLAAGIDDQPQQPLVGPVMSPMRRRAFGPGRVTDVTGAGATVVQPLVAPGPASGIVPGGLGLFETPRQPDVTLNRATPPEVMERVQAFLSGAPLDRAPFHFQPVDGLVPGQSQPPQPPQAMRQPMARNAPVSPLARVLAKSAAPLKPANDLPPFANDGPEAFDPIAANDAPAPLGHLLFRETVERGPAPRPGLPAFEDERRDTGTGPRLDHFGFGVPKI